jgi:hypothetical protein
VRAVRTNRTATPLACGARDTVSERSQSRRLEIHHQLAAEGLEPSKPRFFNLLMARDFWSKRVRPKQLGAGIQFSPVLPRARESTVVLETLWRRQGLLRVCRAIRRVPESGYFASSSTSTTRHGRRRCTVAVLHRWRASDGRSKICST